MTVTAVRTQHDLVRVRLYFFTFIGGGGFLLPFITIFYHRQGLSGTQIGLIGASASLLTLLAAPIWGRWNDKLHAPRRILQAGLILSAVLLLILGRQSAFWPILLINLCLTLAGAGLMPLSDTLALDVGDRTGKGYGSIRLWGSLGWAILTPLAGRLIELLGLYMAFVGHAVTYVISAIIVRFISRPERKPEDVAAASPHLGQIITVLRSNRLMMGLGVAIMVNGLASTAVYQFEPIFMDQLGASETIIGITHTIPAVIELPGMLWADRLARRFGAHWLLRTALLLHMVQMIGVLLMPTIPMLIAQRALGGIQYSFSSIALITLINEQSPKGQRTTILALFTITLTSIANMIGAPVSGLIFDQLGAYWLFAFALAGYGLAWLALFATRTKKTALESA
jgi:MFS family permease